MKMKYFAGLAGCLLLVALWYVWGDGLLRKPTDPAALVPDQRPAVSRTAENRRADRWYQGLAVRQGGGRDGYQEDCGRPGTR